MGAKLTQAPMLRPRAILYPDHDQNQRSCNSPASAGLAGWSQEKGALKSPKNGVNETATILRRFHFSSSLKRMSCIVRVPPRSPSFCLTWEMVALTDQDPESSNSSMPTSLQCVPQMHALHDQAIHTPPPLPLYLC